MLRLHRDILHTKNSENHCRREYFEFVEHRSMHFDSSMVSQRISCHIP